MRCSSPLAGGSSGRLRTAKTRPRWHFTGASSNSLAGSRWHRLSSLGAECGSPLRVSVAWEWANGWRPGRDPSTGHTSSFPFGNTEISCMRSVASLRLALQRCLAECSCQDHGCDHITIQRDCRGWNGENVGCYIRTLV